jgi:hypothetical protein
LPLHTRLVLGDKACTDEQKKEIPPAVWPTVDTHAGSGRKVLFVGVHARSIPGWPTAEARMFLHDPAGARDAARARVHARVDAGRPGDVGQPQHRTAAGGMTSASGGS